MTSQNSVLNPLLPYVMLSGLSLVNIRFVSGNWSLTWLDFMIKPISGNNQGAPKIVAHIKSGQK